MGGGVWRFSKLLSLNTWLQCAVVANNLHFIDNFNLFCSFFSVDGIPRSKLGSQQLAANILHAVRGNDCAFLAHRKLFLHPRLRFSSALAQVLASPAGTSLSLCCFILEGRDRTVSTLSLTELETIFALSKNTHPDPKNRRLFCLPEHPVCHGQNTYIK